ncbi:dTMP kinase [Demequina sp. NBRC 110051]|uniref:dTMP kinase n=1 Tax=Demequina sp. NBRC 110051 TaxID=1570340 RepID=UPI0009FC6840|nr:dTMP kinase [Demequina sp. NBRC 110051]
MSGFFVVFEGGDGVGKTTQIDRLATHLRAAGRDITVTREPGGTDLGVELRQAIMHGGHVAPRAEALLYAADRAHHIATKVRPALEAGGVVIQDRYIDSSVVYQGGARGLGDEVERISRWATEDLVPHLTVVLDMEPHAERLDRDLDRVERETAEHQHLIRQAFLDRAALEPARYAVIDAARSIDEVAADVTAAVAESMAAAGLPPVPAEPVGLEPWGTP